MVTDSTNRVRVEVVRGNGYGSYITIAEVNGEKFTRHHHDAQLYDDYRDYVYDNLSEERTEEWEREAKELLEWAVDAYTDEHEPELRNENIDWSIPAIDQITTLIEIIERNSND